MTKSTTATKRKPQVPDPQSDKFKRAAEEHLCDPDEVRWAERLKKVAKAKPEKPE